MVIYGRFPDVLSDAFSVLYFFWQYIGNIEGTAVGTGLNAHPEIRIRVTAELSQPISYFSIVLGYL